MIEFLNFSKKIAIFDVGAGEGDLSLEIINKGFNLIASIEPCKKSFQKLKHNIGNKAFNFNITDKKFIGMLNSHKQSVIIMQDVIEHINKQDMSSFVKQIGKENHITLIGRTPNLESLFGLRNSFGDNTHIHRFTSTSLTDYLESLGFKDVKIKNETYKITGIVTFLRYPFYKMTILFFVILNFFMFGTLKYYAAANITFVAQFTK